MYNNAPPFWQFVPWIGLLLGFLSLLGGVSKGRKRRLVDDTPTCKTTGVFIGLVELKGTAEVEQPLASFLAEQPCVHYQWSVEEHWSRTVTETYTDSEGKTQTRTRHESGWTTVASGGEMTPFYLQDDCGAVQVLPEGADIEPVMMFDETCTPINPLYYGKGPAGAVADSDFQRRFSERGIPLHSQLYIMGQSRERKDVVAAEIAYDKTAPMYLISTRSEEQVSSGLNTGYWLLGLLGLFLSVGAFFAQDAAYHREPATRALIYILVGVGFLLAWALGWIWMVFNSLVGLRQRVRQSWAQVDVQLKRRHDLIPNLVNTIKGLQDYEKNLQTEVAALRAEMTATPPGVAGPDYKGCAPTLIAITEAYPELKTQESFLNLQKNLTETEQRIALARGYFNEIATFYNTRLEIVPDRFVASLAGLQAQSLMLAESFERVAVEVDFAK